MIKVIPNVTNVDVGSTDKRCLLIEVAPDVMATLHKTTDLSFVVTLYTMLDAKLLARIMPDLVLAPLLGRGFDIMDVAARLSRLGYRGQLTAVTSPLPDPAAVLRELRAHCRGLAIELLEISGDGPLRI